MSQQNFNNIIEYIKRELGQPLTLLEISDDDMYQHIKDHVIPLFCSSHPEQIYTQIQQSDKIQNTPFGGTYNSETYIVYNPNDRIIVRIMDVYYSKESILDTLSRNDASNTSDASIQNTMSSMMESIAVSQGYLFTPPNIISFDNPLSGNIATLMLGVEYDHDFTTMPNYLYNKAFKKMCLVSILRWLVALRSKYSNLTTPFGQVNLNIDGLQQKADKLEMDYLDIINRHTPEILIAWL